MISLYIQIMEQPKQLIPFLLCFSSDLRWFPWATTKLDPAQGDELFAVPGTQSHLTSKCHQMPLPPPPLTKKNTCFELALLGDHMFFSGTPNLNQEIFILKSCGLLMISKMAKPPIVYTIPQTGMEKTRNIFEQFQETKWVNNCIQLWHVVACNRVSTLSWIILWYHNKHWALEICSRTNTYMHIWIRPKWQQNTHWHRVCYCDCAW